MNFVTRATEDTAMYQKETIAVTSDSIDGAIEWLWALDRTTSVSPTATCEALVRAIADTNVSQWVFMRRSAVSA